jgi:hypothetical protein
LPGTALTVTVHVSALELVVHPDVEALRFATVGVLLLCFVPLTEVKLIETDCVPPGASKLGLRSELL